MCKELSDPPYFLPLSIHQDIKLTSSRMVANAGLGPSFFNLWLKAEKYSVVLVNTIPTAGSALQVIFALIFGTIADASGKRMHTANAASVCTIVANIILAIWYVPKAALWFAFFFSFVGNAVQPVIIAWGHEITQHDAELRQLLVATGNIITYTFSATLPSKQIHERLKEGKTDQHSQLHCFQLMMRRITNMRTRC